MVPTDLCCVLPCVAVFFCVQISGHRLVGTTLGHFSGHHFKISGHHLGTLQWALPKGLCIDTSENHPETSFCLNQLGMVWETYKAQGAWEPFSVETFFLGTQPLPPCGH